MPRKQKNLKALIRRRMEKTGELYQTARRQVLAHVARKNRGRPHFALYDFLAAARVALSAHDAERTAELKRRRTERLEHRLRAAVAKLYARKYVTAEVAKFEEKVRQGQDLEDFVLARRAGLGHPHPSPTWAFPAKPAPASRSCS
jgi:hypothetical protein